MVYSTRRLFCLTLCHFVLVFFGPFGVAIASLGEGRADLGAFRTFVWFVLVWICPLLLDVWEGLRFVIVIVCLFGLVGFLFLLVSGRGCGLWLWRSLGFSLTFFMQDSWLSSKADEIQSFADRKDMKKFFDALKTVYGPQSSGTTPLLSADWTSLLTDKEAIWKDGLSTLIVYLIGHHLSMMTLSTYYNRWNVIFCLMSSQLSLKQWKQ